MALKVLEFPSRSSPLETRIYLINAEFSFPVEKMRSKHMVLVNCHLRWRVELLGPLFGTQHFC